MYFNDQGNGFQSTVKCLRLSSLVGQNLRRSFLPKKLQGSNLSRAQLQGADLIEAQLQDANLSGAQLQGGFMANAQLQRADLVGTNLQDTVLSRAQLQGANLFYSNLQGAHLNEAQLQGANLLMAGLQGATLAEAQLQSAILSSAHLQGSDLFKAKMQGANLREAQLQGTNLFQTQLQGADLFKAQLQGAYLSETQLQGANLSEAQMEGVILGGAAFKDAYLGMNDGKRIPVFIYNDPGSVNISPLTKNVTSWGELKKQGNGVANPELRDSYLSHIQVAATIKDNENLVQLFYDAPSKIPQIVLHNTCFQSDSEKMFDIQRLYSVRSIRWRYHKLQDFDNNLNANKQYQELLIDIDRKLCTLPECTEIRDRIERLDCKPFLKKS